MRYEYNQAHLLFPDGPLSARGSVSFFWKLYGARGIEVMHIACAHTGKCTTTTSAVQCSTLLLNKPLPMELVIRGLEQELFSQLFDEAFGESLTALSEPIG